MILKHPILETPLPLGWRITSVNEIKAPVHGACVAGPFGSSISAKYFVDDGVPVIRGSTLTDDLTKFVDDGFVFISEEYATNFPSQQVVADDLVFTCWGTIGQVGIVPNASRFPRYVISNKQLKLRVDPTVALPEYIYYHFAGPSAVEYIRSRAIGAAVPGINLGILKSLPVALPPLATQRQIARTLDTLGDLIDNNLRRIRVLEEVARHHWSRWVHDARRVTAPLGRLVDLVRAQVNPAEIDADTRYIGLEHIPRRSFDLTEHGHARDVVSSKIAFEAGDILFGKIRPYFHKVGPVAFDGVASADTIVMRSRQAIDRPAVLMCVSCDDFVAEISNKANGSKMPRARWEDMAAYEVPLGTESERRALNEVVEPNVALLQSLAARNTTLRRLRDLLLPKLLAGGIDVSRLPLPTEEPVVEAPPAPLPGPPRRGRRKKEPA